jgi:hypothetical protein
VGSEDIVNANGIDESADFFLDEDRNASGGRLGHEPPPPNGTIHVVDDEIPAPATLSLLVEGLLAFGLVRRRAAA